jgi:thiamine pyrophosphate-dependent acetolactate synthase large subunit-like protein
VTGGQATAAADGPVDFCAIARGCGFTSVFEFDDIEKWRADVSRVLAAPGPTFVVLKVAPVPGGTVPRSPAPAKDRARQFTAALVSHER